MDTSQKRSPLASLVQTVGRRESRQSLSRLALVLAIFGASYFLVIAGAYNAQYYMEKGEAFKPLRTIQDALFVWDGLVYHDIATRGYSFDGDTCREHNIVFWPAFPLLARGVAAATGMSARDSGFLVVRLSFLAASLLLFQYVSARRGVVAGLFVLLGLSFSAGSFAFHAYYSESTMLLFLALALHFHERERFWLLGLSAFVLGTTRVTVVPFCLLFCGLLLLRAIRGAEKPVTERVKLALAAALCVGGVAVHLLYFHLSFGNPLELIPAIKYCAWSKMHEPMSLFELVSFAPLWSHVVAAVERPYFFVLDYKTTNLLWTLLALSASIYAVVRRRRDVAALGFVGYFLLTFYANGKAEYLESSYRYYTPMFTIYLMFFDLYEYLRARWSTLLVDGLFLTLFAINVMYMVLYASLFASGRWHFF